MWVALMQETPSLSLAGRSDWTRPRSSAAPGSTKCSRRASAATSIAMSRVVWRTALPNPWVSTSIRTRFSSAPHGGTSCLKCFAYFKLRHLQEAVGECSQLINSHRDVAAARYNRARSFEGLGNYEAALSDFAPIAASGSDNYIRDGAVIEMDHIYALLGTYDADLAILEKYPFVFDA